MKNKITRTTRDDTEKFLNKLQVVLFFIVLLLCGLSLKSEDICQDTGGQQCRNTYQDLQ